MQNNKDNKILYKEYKKIIKEIKKTLIKLYEKISVDNDDSKIALLKEYNKCAKIYYKKKKKDISPELLESIKIFLEEITEELNKKYIYLSINTTYHNDEEDNEEYYEEEYEEDEYNDTSFSFFKSDEEKRKEELEKRMDLFNLTEEEREEVLNGNFEPEDFEEEDLEEGDYYYEE